MKTLKQLIKESTWDRFTSNKNIFADHAIAIHKHAGDIKDHLSEIHKSNKFENLSPEDFKTLQKHRDSLEKINESIRKIKQSL